MRAMTPTRLMSICALTIGFISCETAVAATFTPVADTMVREKSPTSTYGRSALETDAGSRAREESYLRFEVTGATAGVTSAKLRLYASSGSSDGPEAYGVPSSSWSESSMTWNSRAPRATTVTASVARVAAGWVEWDVTSLVKGDGPVSIALAQTSTDGVEFHSREQVNRPELVVVTAPTSVPPANVAITAPTDGESISGVASITATATDTDLRAVDLYVDGVYSAYDISAPFTYSLDTAPLATGTHELKVRAYDATGLATWSSAVLVNVVRDAPLAGTTYYVDALSGSDTAAGTSPTTAWKSLAKAASAPLKPGDALLLKRGGAWTGKLALAPSGTSTARISVGAYGIGALPTITGASTCLELGGSHLRVSEIRTDGCSWSGISVYGDDNILDGVETSNNVVGVHVRAGADRARVLSSTIRDNNRMSVLTVGGDDDSGAFGVLLHGDGAEVAFNVISGSDAFSYDYGRDGAAIEVYGASNSNVHHNVAYDDDAFAELGKPGDDPDGSTGNVFAYNSFTASGPRSTFLVTRGAGSGWGPIYATTVVNNTAYLTGSESQGIVCHAGCSRDILTMRNNIVRAVKQAAYADAPFDENWNLFLGSVNLASRGADSLFLSSGADAGFVDAAAGNLRLNAGSIAIDRGTTPTFSTDLDGRSTPRDGNGDGAAVSDLGPYER